MLQNEGFHLVSWNIHFIENKIDRNQLVQDLLNMVGPEEQSILNSIFFSCMILAECGLELL